MDSEITTSHGTSPVARRALPDAWVDRLFARFSAMFGRTWASQWEGADMASVKAIWAEDLAGCTAEQIRAGIDALTGAFPPSLPEFAQLCRGIATGERDPEQDFVAAVRAFGGGRWPSRAVYWTAVRVGRFDIMGNPWSAVKARWLAAAREVGEAQARGQLPDIPDARPALPQPGQTTLTKEDAAKVIANLKAGLRKRGMPSAWKVIDGGPPCPETSLSPQQIEQEKRRQLQALRTMTTATAASTTPPATPASPSTSPGVPTCT